MKKVQTEKSEDKERKMSRNIVVSGKRKTAIAKATIKPGTGKILINGKPPEILGYFKNLLIKEPFKIAENILKEKARSFDISVIVSGGGVESQTEAARLAIARALVVATGSKELKKAYLHYDRALLVADVRRKEQRKPCDSKARAARQKSYR